jgi:probable HAF family extracellular repeat protein
MYGSNPQMKIKTILLTVALGFLINAIVAPAANAQKYKVIFLGTFGGDQTVATAINDLDDVVGYSQLPGNITGSQHAFLYRSGKLIDLDPNDQYSWAWGINHYEQITGYIANSQTNYAFLYQRGNLTNLGSLSGPAGVSLAFGINDSGAIVGSSTIANGSYVPFLYQNAIMSELGTNFGGTALAINNQKQIVGYSGSHAFLYQNGSFIDLGTLGGSESQAYAINDLNQVVGLSFLASGERHAFLYKNGVMKDLGGVGSWALGINDTGEIVGQTQDSSNAATAFLYTGKTGLVDLNDHVMNLGNGTTPGFTRLFTAFAINKNGNIVGVGNYFNGTKTIQAGFLLKRISK